MKILIISDQIRRKVQNKDDLIIPENVEIVFTDWKNYTENSAFDFDITFVHLTYKSLPSSIILKLIQDIKLALGNGRTIIYFPSPTEEMSFEKNITTRGWTQSFGIDLKDNAGKNFEAVGRGQSSAIKDYLEIVDGYKQIIVSPDNIPNQQILVSVKNSTIFVGAEFQIEKGEFIILPPPSIATNHNLLASNIINLARKYNERATRHNYIENKPDWLDSYTVPRLKDVSTQISKLETEKNELERISSILYTTGEDLELNIEYLFRKLGLETFRQPRGANIDLKAKHPSLGLGFAIEITGVKGIIQKDTNKISQANLYHFDSVGTQEETDRLILLANTEYHLDPKGRKKAAFTDHVVRLIGDKALLITSFQLYELWRLVYEGKRKSEDVIIELHSKTGIYQP